MAANSFQELYVEQLQDLYSAERQIIKALPKMIEAAQSEELRHALNEHLEVTRTQAGRIETICQELGEDPEDEKCKGIEGLLKEGSDVSKGRGHNLPRRNVWNTTNGRIRYCLITQLLGFDEGQPVGTNA